MGLVCTQHGQVYLFKYGLEWSNTCDGRLTDMLFYCWAEDIHGNRTNWTQRFPIDTEDAKTFWDGINC